MTDLAPSRIPAFKRLWSDSGTDPRLMAVGAAARGAWAVILAGADAEGVFRREGTVPALDILAQRLGEDRSATRTCVALLVREGLVAEVPEGLALPREAFARRQPELADPEAVARSRASSERPQARGVAPTRAVSTVPRVGGGAKGGRPRLHLEGATLSATERADRFYFRKGARGMAPTHAGQTFEAWLVESEAGRALLRRRRATQADYARSVADCNETCNETSPDGFVAALPSPQTPLSSAEKKLPGSNQAAREGCNETIPVGCNATLPWGFVATPEVAAEDPEPALPPRALPALDTRREFARSNGAAARAFLDAVNGADVIDGRPVQREVVMEAGQWVKPEHILALGAALIDAGATQGTQLFGDLVNVLRDRDVFRRIYARRACVGTGKITASELVYQDALALKQALNEALARRPGQTLLLAPKRRGERDLGDEGRRKHGGGIRREDCVPNADGPTRRTFSLREIRARQAAAST